MMSTIAALSFGGEWKIYDKSCVGSKSYFKLAEEFKNKIASAAWVEKKRD